MIHSNHLVNCSCAETIPEQILKDTLNPKWSRCAPLRWLVRWVVSRFPKIIRNNTSGRRRARCCSVVVGLSNDVRGVGGGGLVLFSFLPSGVKHLIMKYVHVPRDSQINPQSPTWRGMISTQYYAITGFIFLSWTPINPHLVTICVCTKGLGNSRTNQVEKKRITTVINQLVRILHNFTQKNGKTP